MIDISTLAVWWRNTSDELVTPTTRSVNRYSKSSIMDGQTKKNFVGSDDQLWLKRQPKLK